MYILRKLHTSFRNFVHRQMVVTTDNGWWIYIKKALSLNTQFVSAFPTWMDWSFSPRGAVTLGYDVFFLSQIIRHGASFPWRLENPLMSYSAIDLRDAYHVLAIVVSFPFIITVYRELFMVFGRAHWNSATCAVTLDATSWQ